MFVRYTVTSTIFSHDEPASSRIHSHVLEHAAHLRLDVIAEMIMPFSIQFYTGDLRRASFAWSNATEEKQFTHTTGMWIMANGFGCLVAGNGAHGSGSEVTTIG
jgi:hypothetical protein